MTRAASFALIGIAFALVGCSDPSAPIAPSPVASVPKGPSLATGVASSSVLYQVDGDAMTITNAKIVSVGDGQISGQTATVDAGSSINVSADFSIASILACRFIDCVNATNVERTANFKFGK